MKIFTQVMNNHDNHDDDDDFTMRLPNEMAQELLQLNVGGVHYTTTRATLCRYPNSMLGAMFNGCLSTTKDANGHYFIDRDGHLFSFVLNFLRSSQLALPEDFKHLDQLAIEADFYQVESLIRAIHELQQKALAQRSDKGRLLEVIEVRTGSTATMPTNNSRVKTILSGSAEVISQIPAEFFALADNVSHIGDSTAFTEVVLGGSNIRLRLAEYLLNRNWKLIDSNMSTSAGYDSKSMISSLIIEQSYRDRWLLAATE